MVSANTKFPYVTSLATTTMNKTLTLLVCAVLTVLTGACEGIPTTHFQFTVNGVSYTSGGTVCDTIDLVTLSTEFEATVHVPSYALFSHLSVNGVPLKLGKAKVPVDRIAKDAFLALEWSMFGESGTLMLRTLHSEVPEVASTGTATSPGDFYLSFVYLRLIEKYDNEGRLLYYRFEPHALASATDNTGWWDFKKHLGDDGKTYYSYHALDPKYESWVFAGHNPGVRILLDEHYNPIAEIRLEPAKHVRMGYPPDGHDFYFFNPRHYILMSYLDREVEGDTLHAAYIQEVRYGRMVFDWWSTDYPELTALQDPVFAQSAGADYVHFNSVDVLPDGHLLCSFRHLSTVAKIDRKTGDILWTVNGWKPGQDFDFHGQHYARWHDGGITLFNNGNGTGATTLLRLDVDLQTGAVSGSRKLMDDDYYAQACGALTFSGDHIIAGWGIPGNADPSNRLVTEADASGNVIFSLHWKDPASPYNSVLASYRCAKH